MSKFPASLIIIFTFILFFSCSQKGTFHKNEGFVFGTTYHFTYKYKNDVEPKMLEQLKKINASLSTYDPNSIISRINKNDTLVKTDSYFIECFNRAQEISEITNGAFDITVAPVVNAWGFGFNESTNTDSAKIDSLMQFVGYNKIKLVGEKILKQNAGTMLDASAIAKGFGVDIAAHFLDNLQVQNYMVEIGGEVRVKGTNPDGNLWRIGIDKPIDDPTAHKRELETVVILKNKSLATSGNYRQFYIKDGIRYSHTINPKTGYPARNSLLSASVMANNCLTADAFATAFMVMGVEKSIKLAESLNYLEVFFIYTDSAQNYKTYNSKGFKTLNNPN